MTIINDRYELLRPIGRGGQGQVFEAILNGPGGFRKRVAVKRLHRGDGLRREARLGGLLRHPNLVDVLEVGVDDEGWFCAMELCNGGSVADLDVPSSRAIVDIGLQVAAALSYAHGQLGLVHLDLKPENLLLHQGSVKVADLGIAKADGFAQDDQIRGTREFMAPEQWQQVPIDARADVYALGVVLLKLAGGVSSRNALTVDTPEEGSNQPPQVRWIEPVVARAIASRREDRFDSMADLAEALQGLEVDGPSLAETVGVGVDLPLVGRSTETCFVGRERELSLLEVLLQEPGIVVLKGPGGIGKSRLAAEFAGAFQDGPAWTVDVSHCGDDLAVLSAIAQAVDVPIPSANAEHILSQLGWLLAQSGSALLVVDTLEVLPSAGDLLVELIARAPSLRILATSRVSLPGRDHQLEVETLGSADAVALLTVRVRSRGHDVAGDPALVEIAARLQGVPFALELAASRVGVLSPAEVLERVDLAWLTNGAPDATDREATLTSTLQWSWDLLCRVEREALVQLSVFDGGFSPVAAESVLVVENAPFVLDLLGSLVEQSWLSSREGRFHLLDSARAFARSKGSIGEAQRRHWQYFATFGTFEAVKARRSHGWRARWEALRVDLANVLAAARNAIDAGDGTAVNLVEAAWDVLDDIGPYSTGGTLIDAVLRLPLTPRERIHAGLLATDISVAQGQRVAAAAHLDVALSACRSSGDKRSLTRALLLAGKELLRSQEPGTLAVLREARSLAAEVRWWQAEADALAAEARLLRVEGEWEASVQALRLALASSERSGDTRAAARSHSNLSNVHSSQGRRYAAWAHDLTSLALHRANGTRRSEGVLLGNLAVLVQAEGHLDGAERLYLDALQIHRALGNRRFEGLALMNLGTLLTQRHRFEEASHLLESAVPILVASGEGRFGFIAGCSRVVALAESGSLEAARAELTLLSDERRYPLERPRWILAGAVLARCEGDLEDAEAWLKRVEASLTALGIQRDADLWTAIDRFRATFPSL